jgi:hypothetical protein
MGWPGKEEIPFGMRQADDVNMMSCFAHADKACDCVYALIPGQIYFVVAGLNQSTVSIEAEHY